LTSFVPVIQFSRALKRPTKQTRDLLGPVYNAGLQGADCGAIPLKERSVRSVILSGAVAAALTLGLSACTNPYDPGQRAIGGGLIGAGTGALIGGIAAGGPGAAMGAAVGGGVGAVVGAATTPAPPPRYVAYRGCGPGAHWVRAHYTPDGRRIRGHCAPNY
jgi:hypothetical protein